MGWSIGYDSNWERDIGYGVPATCDHPTCDEKIDRGLGHVCGGSAYGGERGCGLFFCSDHLEYIEIEDDKEVRVCERCANLHDPFNPSPDVDNWIKHKLLDATWKIWREENPKFVKMHSKRLFGDKK